MKQVLFIWFLCGLSLAQVLTWNECLDIAAKHNLSLQIARETLVQEEASLSSTKSGFWPQVAVGANTRHSESTGAGANVTTVKTDSLGYDLSVRQNVFDGFKTWNSSLAAEQELTAAQYDYYITESNVRLTLRNAFIALLKAQEQKELADIIVERRAQNMALLKLKYEGGREHKGSLLLARADLDQAEADVVQAERAITLAQHSLKTVLGDSSLVELVASENRLISAMVKPDLEKIAQTNPLLRQLETKLNAAKYSASAIRADQLPQVYANYQYGRSGDSWPPENSSWSLGANVSFTLFDGDRNGSAERRASSVVTQTALRSADGRQTLLLTMDQAWTDLANARDDVQVRQSFLVAAKERANIANAQYAAGLITFDSWSIIEDSLVNAQKNYVNATAAVLQAEARWLQACGGGFDEN